MQIQVGATRPANLSTDVLVVGVFGKGGRRSAAWKVINSAVGGGLETTLKLQGWSGKPGELVHVPAPRGLRARVLAVASLGDRSTYTTDALRKLAVKTGELLRKVGQSRVAFVLDPALDVRFGLDEAGAEAITAGLVHGGYLFDRHLSKRDEDAVAEATEVHLHFEGRKARTSLIAAGERGAIIGRAQNRARDLVNQPANHINPTTLTEYAVQLAKDVGLEVTVLDEAECAARGMHAFLAVGQGAAVPSSFVHLAHKPKGAKRRIALVGKAVTFDSGGMCLKPAAGQATMKMDMGGSAAVVGTMAAVAQLNLPIEVHGIFAACENMTGADAYHTGDVITAANGKTIEVLNTDAEGRLTLADALHYAAALEPDLVVDMATLTGACIVALGPTVGGLFGTGRSLLRDLKAAGDSVGESLWELPMPPEYKEMLKSPIADLKNIGGRWGGAITAALFLSEFVPEGLPWAHIDIAGPAYMDAPFAGQAAGATGFPVRTLVEWLSE